MSDALAIPAERLASVAAREEELFRTHRLRVYRQVDVMFAWLMVAQWVFAIFVALTFSPYTWAGKVQTTHFHVQAAIFLGGALSALPLALIWLRRGAFETRLVIAISQMLWSALLIHLSGGRIETHFHVFGSLAFLAFYRDWRVLIVATVVVASDHFARGVVWPESVYGTVNPEWWRFLEHAGWVVFEDIVLVLSCLRGVAEMREVAARRAEAEQLTHSEREKTAALDQALRELRESQDAVVRVEKLAAVGQLAASVGHELRNPLATIRNAHTYIARKLSGSSLAEGDPRLAQFTGVVDRELDSCTRIISDLLDFARERPPSLRPCPLKPLVDEAMGVVPPRAGVEVKNALSDQLPIPNLDRDQFRQVIVNLVQNAVEAIPAERFGQVSVSGEVDSDGAVTLFVRDNGAGMPAEVAEKIFQPLYTTKTKGTGLGLAIVAGIVQRHGATITVDSRIGEGTTFLIRLPAAATLKAA